MNPRALSLLSAGLLHKKKSDFNTVFAWPPHTRLVTVAVGMAQRDYEVRCLLHKFSMQSIVGTYRAAQLSHTRAFTADVFFVLCVCCREGLLGVLGGFL